MGFYDALFGSDQSQYTAYAIIAAIIAICITILLTATDVPVSNRILIVFFVIISLVPSVFLTLFELTCIVTGGTEPNRWWCYTFAWILAAFIIIYCIFIVIISLISLFTYNNAIDNVKISEQNNRVSADTSNNLAKEIIDNEKQIEKFYNQYNVEKFYNSNNAEISDPYALLGMINTNKSSENEETKKESQTERFEGSSSNNDNSSDTYQSPVPRSDSYQSPISTSDTSVPPVDSYKSSASTAKTSTNTSQTAKKQQDNFTDIASPSVNKAKLPFASINDNSDDLDTNLFQYAKLA
jgi:hypothetical protein